MVGETRLIDETALSGFRANFLNPDAILSHLPADNRVLLVAAPPGVGKTYAAHGVIGQALMRDHDLVIYVAPTRALIGELLHGPTLDEFGDRTVVLERRPIARCGPLDTEWRELESTGCGALAKTTLCATCPHRDTCPWLGQFDRITEKTQVVVFTEAYLNVSPTIVRRVVEATGATHPLVVFDEASFLTTNLVRQVGLDDIARFAEAVAAVQRRMGRDGERLTAVTEAAALLLDGREDLTNWPKVSRFDLLGAATEIQQAGRDLFDGAFRYVGNDLIELTGGRRTARWFDDDAFHYVPVPDTQGCGVVVFSPYLPAVIIEERLLRPVQPLFEGYVFRHSESRVINIADPVGAIRTISTEAHFRRVADVYVALLLRDQLLDRRAVVVAKKALVPRLWAHIEARCAVLGRPLACVGPEALRGGTVLAGTDVVLINYGIVGVNSLEEHGAIYAFGGYYARQSQLNETYGQSLPLEDRVSLVIRTEGGNRRVLPTEPSLRCRYHARRARAVLEMIERRVVLQALGRVRPFTSPAIVIAFQTDDLSGAFGEVETHARLSQARSALNIPSFTEMARAALGDRLRPDLEDGMSYRSIAARHDLPLSNVFRALKSPPLDELLRGIEL